MKIKIIFLLVTLVVLNIRCFAQTIYVATNGSGTAFSQNAPGNVDDLQKKLQEIGAANPSNITVYFHNGTYTLKKPIRISQDEKGQNSTFLLSSAPGEKATLSGGVKITGWTSYKNGIYKAQVPPGLDTRQLYVDGKLAVRARTPNRENNTDFGPYYTVKDFDPANKKIDINASDNINWNNVTNAEFIVNQHWYQSRLPFNYVQQSGGTLTIEPKAPLGDLFFRMMAHDMLDPGKACYFENSLEFLDAGDEWYLDKNAGVLYYKPGSGFNINDLNIFVPTIETLVDIEGTSTNILSNIEINDLNFAYTTWVEPNGRGLITTESATNRAKRDAPTGHGSIEASYVSNLVIKNCSVYDAGSNGIVLSLGVKDSKITRNHIFQIAGNGISVAASSYAIPLANDADQFTHNLINNNLIENFGIDYTNGVGILARYVSDLTIEHNEVRFGPYTGIHVGSQFGDHETGVKNNVVQFNNIHHVMQVHDDGGAIYTISNQRGTKVCNNWIHDYGKSKWADKYPVNGIYLDNNSAYIQLQNNLLENLGNVDKIKQNAGITTKSHDNNLMQNNMSDGDIRAKAGIEKQ